MSTNSSIAPVTQTLTELTGVVDNLLLLLSEKEKEVIDRRFNLSGKHRHTLEEIGKDFSVTRERVRQIEKNALSKMRRNVFNTPLSSIHKHVGTLLDEYGGLMKEEVLLSRFAELLSDSSVFNPDYTHISLVLNDDLRCVGNTINFYPYVRKKNFSDYSLKFASSKLVDRLQNYGNVREVEKLHDDLKGDLKKEGFGVETLRSLIGIDKRLTLLDDDLVGLLEWRHIHPRTLRDKILFILRRDNQPLHFVDISEKIGAADFDNRPVNVQAVHNELIRHEQFVLIGRGIYALGEWGYQKGTVAEVVEALLKEKKELDENEIISLVLRQRQVKKITIMLALKNGDLFERVGRKRYRLKKT